MTDLALAVDRVLTPPVLYRDASDYDRLAATWFDPRPIPTETAINQAVADLEAEETTKRQQANVILADIRARLRTLEGRSIDSLTNSELRDIVFALAFESGAINRANATINDPDEWITRPQE